MSEVLAKGVILSFSVMSLLSCVFLCLIISAGYMKIRFVGRVVKSRVMSGIV